MTPFMPALTCATPFVNVIEVLVPKLIRWCLFLGVTVGLCVPIGELFAPAKRRL